MTDTTNINSPEDVEEATKHLMSYLGGKQSSYYFTYNGYRGELECSKHNSFACYAPIRNVPHTDIRTCGIGFYYPKGSKIGQRFYDFIFNPMTSPWRTVLMDEPTSVFNKNGDHCGVIFGPETIRTLIESKDNKLFMNMLIASRAINEWPEHIDFWYHAVEVLKIDPIRAFFMSLNFVKDRGGQLFMVPYVANLNHWSIYGTIDYKRMKESNPRQDKINYIGHCFTSDKSLKDGVYDVPHVKKFRDVLNMTSNSMGQWRENVNAQDVLAIDKWLIEQGCT